MSRTYALAATLVVVIGLGLTVFIAFSGGKEDRFAQCRSGAVAGGAGEIGGPFTLVSETGETVTDADVITRPSLIYFGYTFCPDVCPLDAVRNADAADILAGQGRDLQPVMISIDPARDTPEVMADFTDNIYPDFLGLTGSEEQVAAASQAYKTYYKAQKGDPDYYLVDHSTFSYLVLPKYGFVEYFRRDVPAEEVAKKIACFIDAA